MKFCNYCAILTLLLFSAIFLISCNNESNSDNTNTQLKEEDRKENTENKIDTVNESVEQDTVSLDIKNVRFGPAPEMFRQSMNDLCDAYMSITYSLCFSDPKGVKAGTSIFKNMQSKIEPSNISGEMRSYWDKYSENLSSVIANIEASNDLDVQRKYYSRLSKLMTVAIKNYRIKGKIVKKYNCPQALGGKGAYWYFEDSPSYTLMNPYLGQESKDCLRPVETLKY